MLLGHGGEGREQEKKVGEGAEERGGFEFSLRLGSKQGAQMWAA